MRTLALLLLSLPLAASLASAVPAQHTVLRGEVALRSDSAVPAAERGLLLLGDLGCIACHAPSERERTWLVARPAPDLAAVGARSTPHALRALLDSPQRARPGTAMPSMLDGLPPGEREAALDSLVHAMVLRGGPIPESRAAATAAVVERGRATFHAIGCVACHDAEGQPGDGVPLAGLAARTTVEALAAFLREPRDARPAGRMPHFALSDGEARDLAVYLLREQYDAAAGSAPAAVPGLTFEYHERDASDVLPDFDAVEPLHTGVADDVTLDLPIERRDDRFAVRWSGRLAVPRAGRWKLFTSSDDGSRLRIDGEVVVDNDGEHPTRERAGEVELSAGEHDLVVEYFERHGGEELEVSWAGPGQKKERIPARAYSTSAGRAMAPIGSAPFRVDGALARDGEAWFARLGCAACHVGDARPASDRAAVEGGNGAGARPKALADLDPRARSGCLGAAPAAGAPRYALSREQQQALVAALSDRAWMQQAPTAAQRARLLLASHDCYACHERGGVGGPDERRYRWFTTSIDIDLGDEGKLPPPLDGVGDKLRPEALEALLADGRHRVRGAFVRTRMPTFADQPMRELAALLALADRTRPSAPAPRFDAATVEAGRQLLGNKGFLCITCHGVNGTRALGIPGIDLATSHARLDPRWFRRFLTNPGEVKPGTRMPAFWAGPRSPFGDLLGGDTRAQIDAVWSYLSLGASMKPPAGAILPRGATLELVPQDEPILHRTFMKDVGPRTIAVGYPEGVHAAFDAQCVRLALLWRGRFFDQAGVASGRTDSFLSPLGSDVLEVPGPAFAALEGDDAPWPALGKELRDVGGRFLGYRLDPERRPSFRYRLDGVEIEEQPLPELRAGGAALRRRFELAAEAPPARLLLLAWRGARVESQGEGTWRFDGRVTITLDAAAAARARLRTAGAQRELLVPIEFAGGRARVEVGIAW